MFVVAETDSNDVHEKDDRCSMMMMCSKSHAKSKVVEVKMSVGEIEEDDFFFHPQREDYSS